MIPTKLLMFIVVTIVLIYIYISINIILIWTTMDRYPKSNFILATILVFTIALPVLIVFMIIGSIQLFIEKLFHKK